MRLQNNDKLVSDYEIRQTHESRFTGKNVLTTY